MLQEATTVVSLGIITGAAGAEIGWEFSVLINRSVVTKEKPVWMKSGVSYSYYIHFPKKISYIVNFIINYVYFPAGNRCSWQCESKVENTHKGGTPPWVWHSVTWRKFTKFRSNMLSAVSGKNHPLPWSRGDTDFSVKLCYVFDKISKRHLLQASNRRRHLHENLIT